ncbi:hypothetical protein PFISCL1PPCAC_14080, partial [Pristionchus fissidentatus]
DDKFVCRRCRFHRCIAVGMEFEPPSERHIKNSSSPDSAENSPSTSNNGSILVRIGLTYNASIDARRHRELKLFEGLVDPKFAPHPTQKIYLSTYTNSMDILNITMEETRSFVEQAFQTLGELNDEERDRLFSSFFPKFCMLDTIFRTRTIWGEIGRFVMSAVQSCVDIEDYDLWLEGKQGIPDREALIHCLRSQQKMQFDIIVPIMVRAQITIKEFHAALALLLCDAGSLSDFSDGCISVLNGIRAEIFEDLQRHYIVEIGLSDFSTRLGHLITLNHSIRESLAASLEFYQMQQTIFDLYDIEEDLEELFI